MGKNWFSIENKADAEAAEIVIYDEIGFWGVTAKDFQLALKSVPKDRLINLHVNSPGGSVFEGAAVFNLILARKEKVTAYVDGLAASMASVIVMAASKVVMAENAMMMIHDPIGAAYGGSEELRKMADVLDKIGGTIAGAYEKKTGKPSEEVLSAMSEETWFTAKEAKEWGLVDEISGAIQIAATFDLQRFRHVPAAIAAKAEGAPPAAQQTTQERHPMNKLLAALAAAGLIPTAKLNDDEASEAFTAGWGSFQKAKASDAETIKTLRATIEDANKKEAEAFVASMVAEGKLADNADARKAMVSTYLKDPENVKAWTASITPKPGNGLTPPDKKAGADVKGADGNKIDDKSKIDPSLKGRSRTSAAIDAQFTAPTRN